MSHWRGQGEGSMWCDVPIIFFWIVRSFTNQMDLWLSKNDVSLFFCIPCRFAHIKISVSVPSCAWRPHLDVLSQHFWSLLPYFPIPLSGQCLCTQHSWATLPIGAQCSLSPVTWTHKIIFIKKLSRNDNSISTINYFLAKCWHWEIWYLCTMNITAPFVDAFHQP